MSTKQKIMGMTDHSRKSGFGGQMDGIMSILGEQYESFYLGWGFHHDEPIQRRNYTLLNTGNAPFGEDTLGQYLVQIKPEALLVQADARMVMYIPQLLKQLPNKPAWILYPVIDGYVWGLDGKCDKWPGNWRAVIAQADKVVAMTEFGQKILKANGVESTVIYHGIDTSLFKPYSPEQKERAKEQLGIKGKFAVGAIFKQIQRKNPEKHLQAFCVFRKGKEDKVVLVLHTAPNRESGGEYDLIEQCADYGLIVGKDVVFVQQNLPTQIMPLIYNAMDVFWALGTMEGFCLPLVEAMSCGIPVVATESSTFPELLGGTGVLSPIPTYEGGGGVPISFGSYNGVECPIPNPYDVAKKTQTLYADQKLREEKGLLETARAIQVFDWSVIKNKWLDVVKNCIINVDDLPQEWKSIYESVK
jgi:glycosyltransferase involved in cell wall biosynthesis